MIFFIFVVVQLCLAFYPELYIFGIMLLIMKTANLKKCHSGLILTIAKVPTHTHAHICTLCNNKGKEEKLHTEHDKIQSSYKFPAHFYFWKKRKNKKCAHIVAKKKQKENKMQSIYRYVYKRIHIHSHICAQISVLYSNPTNTCIDAYCACR